METVRKGMLLLVEDDKVNQMLGKRMLSKFGYEVEVANDGAQALNMLSDKKYLMIITDIKLPHMNGYELTEIIRKSSEPYSQLPIIAISAYPSSVEKEKAKKAGMNDYISKPFSVTELIDAITRQLNK